MANQDLSVSERSQKLLQQLYQHEESDFEKTSQLLAEFRVLTREKTINSEVLDQECINSLVNYSIKCHTEAQKCLSNLILNYAHLRENLIDPYVNCVEKRLTDILDNSSDQVSDGQTCEVVYYDLRIIFLLSALCSRSRTKIRDRLVNLILKLTSKEAEEFNNFLLVIESLKTLFNLTLDKCINASLAGDVIKKLFAIVGTEKDMTHDVETKSKLDLTDQLLVNLIHLLTNMPEQVYLELSDEDVNKILNHLDEQLKTYSKHNFRDTVLPVLNVCANICKYNERVRQRWFDEIIGSSKEFDKRPEDYDNLRGRLVKLMTSVDVHIKDIAAEFLYSLCGGDTEKLITYTGFGNSAAFLSARGLMTETLSQRSETNAKDTRDKEYQELRGKLDPITGKIEGPKKNPMEGMSEEEKEYHAHELADAIAKLSSLGVVKPMSLDREGEVSELRPRSPDGEKKTGGKEDSE